MFNSLGLEHDVTQTRETQDCRPGRFVQESAKSRDQGIAQLRIKAVHWGPPRYSRRGHTSLKQEFCNGLAKLGPVFGPYSGTGPKVVWVYRTIVPCSLHASTHTHTHTNKHTLQYQMRCLNTQ